MPQSERGADAKFFIAKPPSPRHCRGPGSRPEVSYTKAREVYLRSFGLKDSALGERGHPVKSVVYAGLKPCRARQHNCRHQRPEYATAGTQQISGGG